MLMYRECSKVKNMHIDSNCEKVFIVSIVTSRNLLYWLACHTNNQWYSAFPFILLQCFSNKILQKHGVPQMLIMGSAEHWWKLRHFVCLFLQIFFNNALFIRMQDIFSLNLAFVWGHLKFTYEVPTWIALNWTMWSQTEACIAKSCEICALLRYYAVQSGNFVPVFWDKLSVSSSRVRKSKRENTAWQKLTVTIIFFGASSFA